MARLAGQTKSIRGPHGVRTRSNGTSSQAQPRAFAAGNRRGTKSLQQARRRLAVPEPRCGWAASLDPMTEVVPWTGALDRSGGWAGIKPPRSAPRSHSTTFSHPPPCISTVLTIQDTSSTATPAAFLRVCESALPCLFTNFARLGPKPYNTTMIFSRQGLATAVVSTLSAGHAAAQTWTSCNPLTTSM